MRYGYLRTSTEDQVHGIEAQRITLTPLAIDEWVIEHASGKNLAGRPLFTDLIRRMQKGDVLVVAKIDRFARSIVDALTTMEYLNSIGADLVVVDANLDTTTPAGRLLFGILCQFAQFEREMISARTRDGMAAAKANGKVFGPKRRAEPDMVQSCKADGMTQAQTATLLGVSVRTVSRLWNS